MTKIQSIYAFVTMVVGIAVACFFVFRWTNTRETTDTAIIEWMQEQEEVHAADDEFKEAVTGGIQILVSKVDSALVIGKQNQQAIYTNRSTIIKQITSDTSLTREEFMERMQPFIDGLDDLTKSNRRVPYVYE